MRKVVLAAAFLLFALSAFSAPPVEQLAMSLLPTNVMNEAAKRGIEAVGSKYKVRHRAELGISIDQAFWGLGIGSALMDACIECAGLAGYEQLELNVAAENDRAMSLYRKKGFTEFGRNPRGFKSRISGYQELVYMRLELNRRAPENNQK